jgi:hypothetical protein
MHEDREEKHVVVQSGSVSTSVLIVFVVLKLTNVITWSWLWVLSPLWISIGLVVLVFGIWFIAVVLYSTFSSMPKKVSKFILSFIVLILLAFVILAMVI